jgi:WD40 repeat protein
MFVLGTHKGGLNTNSLAYSPRGRLLASSKGQVRVWDLHERRELREIQVEGDPGSVAFAPDGSLIVSTSGQHAVQVFDPDSGELLRRFGHSWCRAQCALVSGDGKSLYCGGHLHGDKGMVARLLNWNLQTGRPRRRVADQAGDLGFAALSPDGRLMATGNDQRTAWLWDLRGRKLLGTFNCRSGGWRVVAFSPDGRVLAITAGNVIETFDPATQQRRRILRGHKGTVWGIAFGPDGRLFSAGGDGVVRTWDPGSGKELAALDWGAGSVNNVCVAPDGMTAAAGSADGRIVVWDLEAA